MPDDKPIQELIKGTFTGEELSAKSLLIKKGACAKKLIFSKDRLLPDWFCINDSKKEDDKIEQTVRKRTCSQAQ